MTITGEQKDLVQKGLDLFSDMYKEMKAGVQEIRAEALKGLNKDGLNETTLKVSNYMSGAGIAMIAISCALFSLFVLGVVGMLTIGVPILTMAGSLGSMMIRFVKNNILKIHLTGRLTNLTGKFNNGLTNILKNKKVADAIICAGMLAIAVIYFLAGVLGTALCLGGFSGGVSFLASGIVLRTVSKNFKFNLNAQNKKLIEDSSLI